ncbi:MAG: hypothetical protein CME40_16685 [Haliea sp.]|nr:hypothetical protein [Haliea sp.]|tara:strand:- start:95599 stop:96057 length:459 start_codon:yes stop_codon:yes gene_type:complete
MTPVTLKELLTWTQKAHSHLAADLERARQGTGDEPVSYLLDYLAEHEEHLALALERFVADCHDDVLATRVQHYLETRLPGAGELRLGAVESGNGDAFTARIIDCHNRLIQLYRFLGERVEPPHAAEILQEVLELEEKETQLLSHQANRMHDL